MGCRRISDSFCATMRVGRSAPSACSDADQQVVERQPTRPEQQQRQRDPADLPRPLRPVDLAQPKGDLVPIGGAAAQDPVAFVGFVAFVFSLLSMSSTYSSSFHPYASYASSSSCSVS